eukprot:3826878-Prymnesium_polylepis.1
MLRSSSGARCQSGGEMPVRVVVVLAQAACCTVEVRQRALDEDVVGRVEVNPAEVVLLKLPLRHLRQARAIELHAHNVGVEGLDAQLLDDHVREVAGVGRRPVARALSALPPSANGA